MCRPAQEDLRRYQSGSLATNLAGWFTIPQETAMLRYAIAPAPTLYPVSAPSDWSLKLPREVKFDAFPA
jgi:hypothetical protein